MAQKKRGKNQKLKEKDKRKLLARAKQKLEAQRKDDEKLERMFIK